MKNMQKIVILGAGYGGVQAAKLLSKKFKKDDNVEITLIDKNRYHTLMTELHEVAGSRVEQDSVQISLRKIFNKSKTNIVTDEITNIDFENKKLVSNSTSYDYDYLIVGSGSEPADFNVPGVKENSFTIWSFNDAIKIKEHVENMFEKASREKNPEKRKEMLTFAVAGAGFTGIETAGELIEWKKKLSREYDIDEKEAKILVIEAMPKILPILNDKLKAKAERYLVKHGVKVLTNSSIIRVDKNGVKLQNGTTVPTRTLIWTCGVQGSSFGASLGLTMGKRGRIQANEYMQSVDYKNVYIVGDNAYFEENGKSPMPQIVEAALQSAETAVKNIVADMESKPYTAFKSNYHGFMVSIGSRYCVAELAGMSLSGFFAMAMKHMVNLHYLFGIGSFQLCWRYIMHEFFDVKENRSMLGGHVANKTPIFWLAILRVYIGVLWLIEGINKIKDGWLSPEHIYIVSTTVSGVSGASENAAAQTAQTVTSATQAAGTTASSTVVPLLKTVPGFYKYFTDTFIAPHAYIFQVMVVLGEVALGLALIAGLFTIIASIGSIFMCLNFILSAMAGKEILWYIVVSIAMFGGAGRAFGLDYYVMPWLYNMYHKIWYKKKVLVNTGESTI